MSTIKWQPACCAWHGQYAEAPTKAGGVARIKQQPGSDSWMVMVFDASGSPEAKTEDGAPAYVPMAPADATALLA